MQTSKQLIEPGGQKHPVFTKRGVGQRFGYYLILIKPCFFLPCDSLICPSTTSAAQQR